MTKGLTACPPPLSRRCRWPPQGWVSPTVILVDTQVWKLLAWIFTQCIEMMEPSWKKLHPIAYSLSKLTGSGLFGLVRTKELFLRWAEYSVFSPIMRTHEVCLTSSWGHFRFSFPTFKLIVNNTRATNRSRSTNSTQTRTQCSSLVDSRKFSPPWKIIQRSPPHSSLNSKSL